MSYFVTGATGFIGRNLVELLLEREGTIYVLVREGSKGRLAELRNRWGVDEDRVVGIVGDLSAAAPRRLRRGRRAARGRGRPPLPPRRDLRHDRRRGEPAGRQRRGHPPHGPARRGGRGRARPHGQLDRRRRPLQGHLARGHVRRGPGPRQPPLLPDQARVRGASSATECTRPWRVYRPGHRRRQLRDRRDGQDRRPVLLLQADPADPQRRARSGCRCPASRAARSTSSRSTSSSRRWTTSPTSTGSTGGRSASPTPNPPPPAR